MRELFIAFVQKCLGIPSPAAFQLTGGKVKYMYDLIKMRRSEKRKEKQNERDFIQREKNR